MTNGDFEDEEMIRKAEADHPEPYDFEAFSPWSMMTIKGLTMEAFCKECLHRLPSRRVCPQARCDTLECLESRLWKVEG